MAAHPMSDFNESLKSVKALLRLERKYSELNLNPREQEELTALRAAIFVGLVSALQVFLEETEVRFYEKLRSIRKSRKRILLECELHLAHQELLRLGEFVTEKHRITSEAKLQAAQVIAAKLIKSDYDLVSFRKGVKFPKPDYVKAFFRQVGIGNIFNEIRADYSTAWGQQVPFTHISQKLQELIDRRNKLVHKRMAVELTVSRADALESLRFINCLVGSLQRCVSRHLPTLMQP